MTYEEIKGLYWKKSCIDDIDEQKFRVSLQTLKVSSIQSRGKRK